MKDGYKCLRCKRPLKVKDDPENFIFEAKCPNCGWTDGRSYYDIDGDRVLMSKEEANKRGLKVRCEVCGKELSEFELKAYGICEKCYFNEDEYELA